MIYGSITFTKAHLDDPPSLKPDAITGKACAEWVITLLPEFGAPHDEMPTAEDWGYGVRVNIGPDTVLLGFASAFDGVDRWRIIVGDNFTAGILPWTKTRRREAAMKLASFLDKRLAAAEGVSDVRLEDPD
ncbi:MAG TPA: hypothetical protein VG841_06470 [Caulobacterales bacterium]|nr:hypothetical protein [Caulobacterales bacterium]